MAFEHRFIFPSYRATDNKQRCRRRTKLSEFSSDFSVSARRNLSFGRNSHLVAEAIRVSKIRSDFAQNLRLDRSSSREQTFVASIICYRIIDAKRVHENAINKVNTAISKDQGNRSSKQPNSLSLGVSYGCSKEVCATIVRCF